MELQVAIQNFGENLVNGVMIALGVALVGGIVWTFTMDLLRKRAAEKSKVWKNL